MLIVAVATMSCASSGYVRGLYRDVAVRCNEISRVDTTYYIDSLSCTPIRVMRLSLYDDYETVVAYYDTIIQVHYRKCISADTCVIGDFVEVVCMDWAKVWRPQGRYIMFFHYHRFAVSQLQGWRIWEDWINATR